MTQSQLDLRELLAKATPGPWYHRQPGVLFDHGKEGADWIADAPQGENHTKIICQRGSFYGGSDDYALIVALRNGADELLDENERLRGALESIHDIDGPYCDNCHSNEIHQAHRLARAALHPKQERDDAAG